ncbi:MAG: NigD-like protein [Muribaculaceae bacterium]
MKFISFFRSALVVAMAAVMLTACNDDDIEEAIGAVGDPTYGFANALVTAKTADDGTFFLQLTDEISLLPVNVTKSPYDKEVRALVNYTEVPKEDFLIAFPDGDLKGCNTPVRINWIDSILTKMPVPDLLEMNDATYGSDCVEIVNDWVTIAEDGYLTLRFRTRWGGNSMHRVNLITGVNPENPYEVEFRHDANGDVNGIWGDALVAFNLNDLPDTNGETVKLTLRWKAYSGDKKVEFDFCSRKATGGNLPTENLMTAKLLN